VTCPATGGEHVWTDAVDVPNEHLRPPLRWHCDECGRSWEDVAEEAS
jgi:hypothetical protein